MFVDRLTGRNAFIEGDEEDWHERIRNRVFDSEGLEDFDVSIEGMSFHLILQARLSSHICK